MVGGVHLRREDEVRKERCGLESRAGGFVVIWSLIPSK